MRIPRPHAALRGSCRGLALLLATVIGLTPTAAASSDGTPADSLITTPLAKLFAADAAAEDRFGGSVAISGDTAVVGSSYDDDAGIDSGSAYVFQRTAGVWNQVIKLVAADAAAGDAFGVSVAISGDTVVVGALDAAYLFQRNAGGADQWGQVAKWVADDALGQNAFGRPVAISGDTVVVGAVFDDDVGEKAGAAYVFQRDAGGTDNWGEVAKLTAADGAAYDYLGYSVSISADTVVAGAYSHDSTGQGYASGAAFVFERHAGGADRWGQVAKLVAGEVTGDDWFGFSVSIRANTIVVGAPYSDAPFHDEGAAFVYERNAGGEGHWGRVAKLTAADGQNDDDLGSSVSVNGDTVVAVDSGGVAYLFRRDAGGVNGWAQVARLTIFGRSVSLSGDTLLAGAGEDDDAGTDAGAAYVFRLTPCESCANGVLDSGEQCDDGNAVEGDGCDATCAAEPCVDMDGDGLGSLGSAICPGGTAIDCDDADPAVYPGATEVCNGADEDCDSMIDEKIADVEIGPSDLAQWFGAAVSISQDTAVVGDPRDDHAGVGSGAAYLFARDAGGSGNWGQVAKLTATEATTSDHFGSAVAIDGDIVLVSAPDTDPSSSVYVFERDAGGLGNWGEVAKLTNTETVVYASFGASVAISGDTAVVGDYGYAYVFQRDAGGPGNWGQVARLVHADPGNGNFRDRFGHSVSISGDRVVVGAEWDDDVATRAGSAFVFERDAGGSDAWGQVAQLNAADGAAYGYFGDRVSISGDTIVVRTVSSVYVFERNAGGAGNWGQVAKLADTWSDYGASVSVDGDLLVVGAEKDNDAGPLAGAALVYDRNTGGPDSWGFVVKLTAARASAGDQLGAVAALDGSTVIAGGRFSGDSAHLFDLAAAPVCGDGILGCGEACDDGDILPGDGCSATCGNEPCADADGDGFGIHGSLACPGGSRRDCNDADPGVHPAMPESCNGADDDCDGVIDDDPIGRDTDGDGIRNACDNCPVAFNPAQLESDGDGRADACDNCPGLPNADQTDTDCDGFGDACDPCPTDPLDDDDGDGVCGSVDNCPDVANPGQTDSDQDTVGDLCDNCSGVANADQTDRDADGRGDACDNCVFDPNPDQANGDLAVFGQWAVSAMASSELTSTDWSAARATGVPELAQCASVETNWAPLSDGTDPEWLELSYATPIHAIGVDLFESGIEQGFVDRIELRDAEDGLHTVWEFSDDTVCGDVLAPRWPASAFPTSAAVVHTAVGGWEEIDAVRLVGVGAPSPDTPGNACDVCPFVADENQLDSDGDGAGDACDCAPGDPAARPAGAVRGVAVSKPLPGVARLAWPTAPAADGYSVTRGRISTIGPTSYGDCVVPIQAETTHEDAALPPAGDGFAYLIRGVNSECGIGTPGAGPDGTERRNSDPGGCR